jgi:hypothetical protein
LVGQIGQQPAPVTLGLSLRLVSPQKTRHTPACSSRVEHLPQISQHQKNSPQLATLHPLQPLQPHSSHFSHSTKKTRHTSATSATFQPLQPHSLGSTRLCFVLSQRNFFSNFARFTLASILAASASASPCHCHCHCHTNNVHCHCPLLCFNCF